MIEQSRKSSGQPVVINHLIWVFVISFIVHNLEELIRMPEFLVQHWQEFPAFFQQISGMWNPQSFSLSIWLLNGLVVLVGFVLTKNIEKHWAHLILTFLAGMMTINALMHLGQSLYLQTLVPGVVTAIVLIVPVTSRILTFVLDHGQVTCKQMLLLLGAGLVTMPLLIWLLMQISHLLLSI